METHIINNISGVNISGGDEIFQSISKPKQEFKENQKKDKKNKRKKKKRQITEESKEHIE